MKQKCNVKVEDEWFHIKQMEKQLPTCTYCFSIHKLSLTMHSLGGDLLEKY